MQLNGHTTLNWFDGDITSIRWRENIDKFPLNFEILFWCNFDGRKIDVILTYFIRRNFDGRKIETVLACFVRRNFNDQKIDFVSMYFGRCNFNEQNIDVVSTYFSWHNFNERKIYIISFYFFRSNFDGQKKWRCFDVFFDANLMENWCKFKVLIFICFWKTKNCYRFDISFWKVFDISKLKPLELLFWPLFSFDVFFQNNSTLKCIRGWLYMV